MLLLSSKNGLEWLEIRPTPGPSSKKILKNVCVEFGGRNKVRDIVFEEESTSIPTIACDNVQVPIPVIDQEANLDPQPNNVDQPPIQDEVIVPEEQTQQPQEPVPLRRSTREMRNAIPDNFFVFI